MHGISGPAQGDRGPHGHAGGLHAAAQAGQMATMGAMQAGTVGATVTGGVSLVVGMLLGIIIARAGQRRLL